VAKKYRVTLRGDERAELEAMISRGKVDARMLRPSTPTWVRSSRRVSTPVV